MLASMMNGATQNGWMWLILLLLQIVQEYAKEAKLACFIGIYLSAGDGEGHFGAQSGSVTAVKLLNIKFNRFKRFFCESI